MNNIFQPRRPRGYRRLDADAVALYRYAVANPNWTPKDVFSHLGMYGERLDAAIQTLVDNCLLRLSTSPDNTWETVSPHSAAADLLADEEARVRREEMTLTVVREDLLGLLPAYVEARRNRAAAETIDIVEGAYTVSRLLTQYADRSASEVCIASPGVDEIETRWVRENRLDALRAPRLVLEHVNRGNELIAGSPSAAVRTVPRVPTRMVVFDRSTAFLPMTAAGTGHRMALVQHPTVVESLAVMFELLWHSAQPLPGDAAEAEDCLRDQVRREILIHLAAGEKDEMVARRLGLSVRTCRRHIAAIMDYLGATSRFQAGALAHRLISQATE